MKIVSLEVKKIEVGKFFPKEGRAELRIMFNDGNNKEIIKKIDVYDSENAAEGILLALRKLEKRLNKNETASESLIDNFVNIVVKDEDRLIKNISEFIQKISIKMDEIKMKKEAEGYLNVIREFKDMKLEF